ncbi:MAG: hypothetical protein WC998_09410 [Candidatus Paceibacterota bacterium]|jgi:hypothetical protein
MINRVGNLKNAYMTKVWPNAVFFGHKEYDEVLRKARDMNCCDIPEFKTFMGMEMLEVDKESYFKVGLIEG